MTTVPLRLLLAALVLTAVSACDSGDAIDAPTAADVAGVYDITALRFVPDASAVQPVNVQDTLIVAESSVRLFDGGQGLLEFRREGGTTRVVLGDFEVRRQELRLTFEAGNEAALSRLLLPQVLTFTRDGDDLTFSAPRTANLDAYDSQRYSGFTAVEGTLAVRLELRAQ